MLELIGEKKTISKTLEDYEDRRATALTTAHRLADFLGAETVQDRGLSCHLILSKYPTGAPITERAIPVAIFSTEPVVMQQYLRKWLKEPELDCSEEGWSFRKLVDWDYYIDRLGKSIQKIVSIPAGLQGVPNPCPRVQNPTWLQRVMNERFSARKQSSITSHFKKTNSDKSKVQNPCTPVRVSGSARKLREKEEPSVVDVEDIAGSASRFVAGQAVTLRSPSSTPIPAPVQLFQQSTTAASTLIPPPIYPHKPESKEEFIAWLSDRKTRWKSERTKKRLSSHGGTNSIHRDFTTADQPVGTKRSIGVVDLVRNAALSANQGIWQILELQELDGPGEFCVWVIAPALGLIYNSDRFNIPSFA